MSTQRIGLYLEVEELPPVAGRKTKRWRLLSTRGADLGTIEWYGGWRCYALSPAPHTVFNAGCLDEVARFLVQVRKERL